MKKIQLFLAALVVVIMTSCVKFKTEATVDVEVLKSGKPVFQALQCTNSKTTVWVKVRRFTRAMPKKARRPIQAALRISISNRRMISTRAM